MNIGEFCNRNVITVLASTPLREAAALMREYHVGGLVVIDVDDGRRVPIGILTDRDIVVETVALGIAVTEDLLVGDLVMRELVSVDEQRSLFDTVQLMRSHAVRRLPVTDDEGELLGIVTVSDLLAMLADELTELALIGIGQRQVERLEHP